MDTDQLKPFDLEKAKAGKPIQTLLGIPVKFLGVLSNGRIAVEIGEDEKAHATDFFPESLRMRPEVKKFKGVLYAQGVSDVLVMSDTEQNRNWAKHYRATLIKEFEVEYEDE